MASLKLLKIIAAVLLLIVSYGSSVIPFKSKSFRTSPKMISAMNCFSSGIFLGAGFVHLIPEALENWAAEPEQLEQEKTENPSGAENADHSEQQEQHKENPGETKEEHEKEEQKKEWTPIIGIIVVASFAFILLADKVICKDHSHYHGGQENGHSCDSHSHQDKTIHHRRANELDKKFQDDEGTSKPKKSAILEDEIVGVGYCLDKRYSTAKGLSRSMNGSSKELESNATSQQKLSNKGAIKSTGLLKLPQGKTTKTTTVPHTGLLCMAVETQSTKEAM